MERPDIISAVKDATAAGIAVVPCRQDGTKAPVSEWKHYQSEPPDRAQLKIWYVDLHSTGMGYVTGRVSGDLECFEFDAADVYEAFRDAARRVGYGELIERIEQGYSDRSPSGGVHWYYRCDEVAGNTALAKRPNPGSTTNGKALIETRGEGGYVIAAPSHGSVHPSKKPYMALYGDPSTMTRITPQERADLFALARTLDEMPVPTVTAPPAPRSDGSRPGDEYNARATWRDILEPHGWQYLYERAGVAYWRRPGKHHGQSATTNWSGLDCLRVFTSSTVLEAKMYQKFTAYAALNHEGDYRAAARELAQQGYGSDEPRAAGKASTGQAEGSEGARPTQERTPIVQTLADVQPAQLEWLWQSWLPERMLTLLGGYAGDGKSTLLTSLMATLSRGGMLPDGTRAPVVNSLMLAAEDDAAYAIRPRLDLHKADTTRIHLLRGTQREDGTHAWPDLRRDVDMIRTVIRAYDIGLVAIDPLSSYMTKADRNSEGDVRDALMPLQQLMEDTGVAVIGVMHVGKADAQRRAAQRLLGSTAFTALARTVWMVHDLPDEYQPDTGRDDATGKRKVLGVVKANYSIPPRPLAFSRPLDGPLIFHGPSPVSIEEAFAGTPKEKKQDEAAEWLADYLKGGMKATQDVKEAAERAGINERTLRRARETLDVRTHKERRTGGRWFLSLPSGTGDADEELGSLHNGETSKGGQGENLALFPESQEDDQLLPGGHLRAVYSRKIKGGQNPSIDKLAAFDSSSLDPTGTDDSWSMDL